MKSQVIISWPRRLLWWILFINKQRFAMGQVLKYHLQNGRILSRFWEDWRKAASRQPQAGKVAWGTAHSLGCTKGRSWGASWGCYLRSPFFRPPPPALKAGTWGSSLEQRSLKHEACCNYRWGLEWPCPSERRREDPEESHEGRHSARAARLQQESFCLPLLLPHVPQQHSRLRGTSLGARAREYGWGGWSNVGEHEKGEGEQEAKKRKKKKKRQNTFYALNFETDVRACLSCSQGFFFFLFFILTLL